MTRRPSLLFALVAVVMLSSLLAGCGATPTPTATPVPPTAAATAVPSTKAPPTAVPPTAAPTKPPTPVPPTATKGPQVGGNFVWAVAAEPDTLDPHKTGMAVSDTVNSMYGGAVVTYDKDGKIVPYIAEKWTISTDGLTYTFTIKKGVKFHNGDPLTAKSFVYAYTRAKDPATKSTASASMLGPVVKAEATDDSTLVLTLENPNFWLLDTLIASGYLMPLDQAAVEKGAEQYGRAPVGVGPYKFKSWTTGQSIVLERNPDFNWGPTYYHGGGPWYFGSITFRIIPDYSTMLAGLEAGEIDYLTIQTKDLERLKANPKVQIANLYQKGMLPYVSFNVSKPPFNDLKVRMAFSYAIDRQLVIKASYLGNAVEQHGPCSLAVIGYWPGVEAIGQSFDLAKAKQLMKDAGYTYGADGMLSKDGQPFKITFQTLPIDIWVKNAQILQQFFKALGADVTLQQLEQGVLIPQMMMGDYTISMMGMTYPWADLMYMLFHSSNIGGGLNLSQVKDAKLDAMLEQSRSETDRTKQQQIENDIQKYIVENATVAPICTPMNFVALSGRIKGWQMSNASGMMLGNAYIQQ